MINDGVQATTQKGVGGASAVSPSASVPLERYDLRILSSLRRIIRSVDSHSRKLAVEYGMTVPQLLCMLKLEEKGPLTVKQLSAEVFLNASTVVGIVDRLERSGMLARERTDSDRRKVQIVLTKLGKEMLSKSPSPLQKSLVDSLDRLPDAEKASIAVSLETLVSCIDNPATSEITDLAAPVLEASLDLKATKGMSPKLGDNFVS